MYVTMFPVILAGILNMLFVKTSLYRRLKSPMDGGLTLWDGRRMFGDNKTWAGFFGMILAGALSQMLWGLVCLHMPDLCYIYHTHENTPPFNLLVGGAMGLAYMLFELPNSFVKRRLAIPCGKTVGGLKGGIFFVVDQVDSLFGVGLVFALLYPMPLWQYFLYILLGAVTHIAVNGLLYKAKIRRNL